MQKHALADRNEFVQRARQSAAAQKEDVSRRAHRPEVLSTTTAALPGKVRLPLALCDLPEQNLLERCIRSAFNSRQTLHLTMKSRGDLGGLSAFPTRKAWCRTKPGR